MTQAADSSYPPDQIQALTRYADLLSRYNDRFNLVSRQDIDRLWERHIDDALGLASLLQPGSVLDVGSGGGLPGMVLAITHPDRVVCLLERSQRKANFLRRVVAELDLVQVEVLCEDMAIGARDRARFDNICARAVAPADELWPPLQAWLAPGGQMLVAYGPRTRDRAPVNAVVDWLPGETNPEVGVMRVRRTPEPNKTLNQDSAEEANRWAE